VAKKDNTFAVVLLGPVQHDGESFGVGDTLRVDEQAALALVRAGVGVSKDVPDAAAQAAAEAAAADAASVAAAAEGINEA
jgi:hypothetical protein